VPRYGNTSVVRRERSTPPFCRQVPGHRTSRNSTSGVRSSRWTVNAKPGSPALQLVELAGDLDLHVVGGGGRDVDRRLEPGRVDFLGQLDHEVQDVAAQFPSAQLGAAAVG